MNLKKQKTIMNFVKTFAQITKDILNQKQNIALSNVAEKRICYFPEETAELHNLLIKAEQEANKKEYRYSMFWSRIVLEKALKIIVSSENKDEFYKDSTYKNLVKIEKMNIFDESYFYHLHKTRVICNINDHEIENEYGGIGAFYVIKHIKNLLHYIDNNIYNFSFE